MLWTLYHIVLNVLIFAGMLLFAWALEHFFSVYDGFWWAVIIMVCVPMVLDLVQGNEARLFREHHGMGVCETLKEDAYVVALFVEDEESSWSQEEIDRFMADCIGSGVHFIEAQAVRYGQDINIGFGSYQENGCFKTMKYDGKIAAGSEPEENMIRNLSVLKSAARGLGYGTVREMLRSDRKTTGQKQIAYLICVNKPGRSYAWADSTDRYFVDKVEYAVLYARYPGDTADTTAMTAAHETLHLFGADDYYLEGSKNKRRSTLAAQLCPTDIMLCGSRDVWQLSVEDFTAYTVGWLDKYPKAYKKLNWWR